MSDNADTGFFRNYNANTFATETEDAFLNETNAGPFGRGALVSTLNQIDMDHNRNIRVYAKSELTSETEGKIKNTLGSWGDSRLYGAAMSWVDISRLQVTQGVQKGSVDAVAKAAQSKIRVTFPATYRETPSVQMFLTGLDMGAGHNFRIQVYAKNIDKAGFDAHIEAWDDTVLYGATASWIAAPPDHPGVRSGSFWLDHVSEPTIKFSSAFQNTPGVFVGISRLDFSSQHNLRVKVIAMNVNASGFQLQEFTWDDTILYHVGGSYLAWGDG